MPRMRVRSSLGAAPPSSGLVGAPEPVGDKRVLQASRRFTAGNDAADIGADAGGERAADALGRGRITLCPLLDHPLHGRDGEGDAAGLDALQVDGGEQRVSATVPCRRQIEILDGAQILARGNLASPGVEKVRRRRGGARDVAHAAIGDDDRARALRRLHSAKQNRIAPVARQDVFHFRFPK